MRAADGCGLAQGPMRLMAEGYRRHGEVFTVPVLHRRITFLLGPEVSAHFFKATDDEMSQKEVGGLAFATQSVWITSNTIEADFVHPFQVYEFNVPTFGKGVVFDVDHKVGLCLLCTACHSEVLHRETRFDTFRHVSFPTIAAWQSSYVAAIA